MTVEQELAALKARVAELESRPARSTSEWLAVRKELESALKERGIEKTYPLLSAFSAICHNRFQVRNVSRLSSNQANECRALIEDFINIACRG